MRYRISVIGKTENGHPVQVLTQSFSDASATYDSFCEKYPHHQITLLESSETEVVSRGGKLPKCPRGHGGMRDRRWVVKETAPGRFYCEICGEIFAL